MADRWDIDPLASSVTFKVRHLIISSTRGRFRIFSGHVQLDEADLSKSVVQASVDVGSVDTEMRDRDDALRGRDFFDVGRFPSMTFASTSVTDRGRGRLRVSGELTLKSTRRPITLEVELAPPRGTRRRAKATAQLSRKEFKLVWGAAVETGGIAVGDRVDIELDVELWKKEG